MKPIRVEFQAFGPYLGHEVVDFEKLKENDLCLICGKTGYGKTMILDAMTFALYGKSSGEGRNSFAMLRCTMASDETPTFVKLIFENNGKTYLFERSYTKKRSNFSELYNVALLNSEGIFVPLSENQKKEDMNRKAEEIIGLSFDQFVQVVILPQGKFEKFLTSKSEDKEKILTNIFGEEKWHEIAERMYSDAAEKKKTLKSIQDKILTSLREEKCESIEELFTLIEARNKDLIDLKAAFDDKEYDIRIRQLNDLLKLLARFSDLEKSNKKLEEYRDNKSSREDWEQVLIQAERAEKIRPLLQEVIRASKEKTEREKQYREAVENGDKCQKRLSELSEKKKEYLLKESSVEEKKALKIRYESKEAIYAELGEVQKELEEKVKIEEKAKIAEDNAKKNMDALKPIIDSLESEFRSLQDEYKLSFDKYIAGITGELADRLVTGQPCPVCGSMDHPNRAHSSSETITRAQIDEKKLERDNKEAELNDTLQLFENKKKEYETLKQNTLEATSATMTVKARLDGMRESLVDGISSIKVLKSEIDKLDKEINEYLKQKSLLDDEERLVRESFAQAGAIIESALKEKEKALLEEEKVEKLLSKGLKDNGFSSTDEATELLMEAEERENLKKQIMDFDAKVKAEKEHNKSLTAELSAFEKPDEGKIHSELKMIDDEKEKYFEKSGALESEIKRLNKKKLDLESISEGMDTKIRQADEDLSFAKKLRGESGMGIQRYVLGVRFSSVIEAANEMLKYVHSGRYKLFRTDELSSGTKKGGLELKVFDNQSDEHDGRAVSTLSGGEKFLVSLALSIGMSTVAQKSGIRIEALFIDEGFGSLDEDSIDDAMSILASIQQANGFVGIISHVKLLRERIPSKLLVVKTESGSKIKREIG